MSGSDAPSPMTLEALRELGSRDDTCALNALAEAVACGDQFVRRMAVEIIGRHSQGLALRGVILKALSDQSGYVVRTACEVVARWQLIEARESVVALLTNASAETLKAAIRTLDTIWLDADFLPVFRIYTGAPEIGIRTEAAWVLRRRAASANWRLLFDAFGKDGLPRHRQWACELAETFSEPDIVPVLLPLASDADGHVRKAALQAIRTLSSRE
jgi:hypothetical protein